MNSITLNEIKKLPSDAVFGLISDSSKEVYVSHTTNLRSRIGLIMDNFSIREDTRLVVFLDGVYDKGYKQIFAQYHLDKYISDGYRNVGIVGRSYINYKVRVQYSELLNEVLVTLTTKRGDKMVVGVFSNVDDANKFVDDYYKLGEMVQPIYAINERTVRWIGTHKGI